MANAIQADKSFLEKLKLYFENYPGRCCDVSFVVGTGNKKEVVQTSRIFLEVACPEFIKLFDEKWGQAVVVAKNAESGISEIHLPNMDPKAFKFFLKLLMVDNVSTDSELKELNASPEDLFQLIELCKTFMMFTILEDLELIIETAKESSIQSLYFLDRFKIAYSPPFVCDGKLNPGLYFQVNQKIEIVSVGFLGPVDFDSFYDVSVMVETNIEGYWKSLGKVETRVFAKKDQNFYVSFEEPIKVKPTRFCRDYNELKKSDSEYYRIHVNIKGPNTYWPVLLPSRWFDCEFQTETKDGTKFFCMIWEHPLAEICFRKRLSKKTNL